MSKKISKILLAALLVAGVTLSAFSQARASGLTCTNDERANFECFVSNGTTVKVVKDSNGMFPVINSAGDSVFQYQIECSAKTVGDVLALFPLFDWDSRMIVSYPETYTLRAPGEGDRDGSGVKTNFGIGQIQFQTFEWNNFNKRSGTVTVTIEGSLSARHGPMLLQITGSVDKWQYGDILLPAPPVTRQGTALSRCITLEENLSVKVFLDPATLCATKVLEYRNSGECTGESEENFEVPGGPTTIFSDTGNQYCEGGFRRTDNSPACFEYVSGGRTRYIPQGCR